MLRSDRAGAMKSVQRASWFIERHLSDDITLDDIATASGVSRCNIVRAFSTVTGRSVMRYVRARRLTEAARLLANGAPSILTTALDANYGSNEAFTRAFRDQFGLTPEAVRSQRHLENLELVTSVRIDERHLVDLHPPRLELGKPMLIAGLTGPYDEMSSLGMAAQWLRFRQYYGIIPGQIGGAAYGVRINRDNEGNTVYVTGVEIDEFSELPAGFNCLRLPARTYAIFSSRDHVSTIRGAWMTIQHKWLPVSGYKPAHTPGFVRYDDAFNPHSGTGGFEIWLPLVSSESIG